MAKQNKTGPPHRGRRKKRKQSVYRTSEQRQIILAEYEAAPFGEKKLVIVKYDISTALICYWRMRREKPTTG